MLTAIDVQIDCGLVLVSTRRLFRNVEAVTIEATMTFPVPVHATLFALEARIGDRLLVARAQRRHAARERYEAALDEGKAAVLHEELLRGVHMLSVAPLAPGAEIEVIAHWVGTLSFVGNQGQIRLPMTVGEIYGRSPLADFDDLLIEGPGDTADLTVRCHGGTVTLLGRELADGRAQVPLDAPVDLVVAESETKDLRGLSADGREVVVRISPNTVGEGLLDTAILLDRSGSMGAQSSGLSGDASKHQLAVAALAELASWLREGDAVRLWEFDDVLSLVGGTVLRASAEARVPKKRAIRDVFRAVVAQLGGPRGGTEIGEALRGAIKRSKAADLLLITDGKSHALDVHALAKAGRRISVLLVGEDSLEANVGHLAALTGGDLFVAMEENLSQALAAAVSKLRSSSEPASASPTALQVTRGNAVIEAHWHQAQGAIGSDLRSRAVAVLAAGLQFAYLPEDEAAALAEAEGIVTHLTSLILADEVGDRLDGIPSTRKVPLPEPRVVTGDGSPAARLHSDSLTPLEERVLRQRFGIDLKAPGGRALGDIPRIERIINPTVMRKLRYPGRSRQLRSFLDQDTKGPGRSAPIAADGERVIASEWAGLLKASEKLNWESEPSRLLAGDLASVEASMAKQILRLATSGPVIAASEQLGIDPLVIAMGILARHNAERSRAAARIARSVFGGSDPLVLAGLLDVVSPNERSEFGSG